MALFSRRKFISGAGLSLAALAAGAAGTAAASPAAHTTRTGTAATTTMSTSTSTSTSTSQPNPAMEFRTQLQNLMEQQGELPRQSTPGAQRVSAVALDQALRSLMAQHMEWTYATIAALAAGSNGLSATLNRLYQNQVDIGNAFIPYYGQAAGNQLTALLHAHISDCVLYFGAVKGDAEQSVIAGYADATYANAKAIADFMAGANPYWSQSDMEPMWAAHITETVKYGGEQLQGDFAASIADYGMAEAHMISMADMIAQGLVAQFPGMFTQRDALR